MTARSMQEAIDELDKVVGSVAFASAVEDFASKCCEKFQADARNEKEYETMHQEYMGLAAQHLQQPLADRGLDFAEVMATLPSYIEAEQDQVDAKPETLDMLLNYTDFEAFKESVLVKKQDLDSGHLPLEVMGVHLPHELREVSQHVAELETAAEDSKGWYTVVEKPWLRIDRYSRKPATSQPPMDYLRTSFVVDMPLEDTMDMLAAQPGMRHWFPMMTSLVISQPISDPLDRLVEMTFKMPLLPSIQCGGRWRILRDLPDSDAFTIVYHPDDRCPGMQSIATGVCRSVPGDIARSRVTMIEEAPPSWIPNFLIHFLAASCYPRMLAGMKDKYKEYRQRVAGKGGA